MPATYTLTDDSGRVLTTVPNVLDPVELTGVELTSGSNIVTVGSVSGLHPFMAVHADGIPHGAFISAIKGLTLELWASTWNDTNGRWSTSAANANATKTYTGGTARASGHNPVPIERRFAMGCWMNELRGTNSVMFPIKPGEQTVNVTTNFGTQPVVYVPAWDIDSFGLAKYTSLAVRTSDSALAIPLKRHEGEPWSVWTLVCLAGHVATLSARPDYSLVPSSYTAP